MDTELMTGKNRDTPEMQMVDADIAIPSQKSVPGNVSPSNNVEGSLPSIKDLDLPPSDLKQDKPRPYILSRRNSLPVHSLQNVEEDVDQEGPVSSQAWRRTSLQGNEELPRLRLAPKAKVMEDMEDESAMERRPRKRSISEDVGDQDFIDDSDEDGTPRNKPIKKTKGRKPKGSGYECAGKDKCGLCKNGIPYYLQKSMNPGWRETLIAVFEHFSKRITYREWCKLNTVGEGDVLANEDRLNKEHVADIEWLYLPDAYSFLEYHWDILCPPQHRNRAFSGANWRKTLQDTLSHNRTYFISGKDLFGKTGYWRLGDNIPVQNGICDSKAIMEMKMKQAAPKAPSMFTIDAILKKAEQQGQIPSFSGSYNAVIKTKQESFMPDIPPSNNTTLSPTSDPDLDRQITSPPNQTPELDLLICAIEKMHNSSS